MKRFSWTVLFVAAALSQGCGSNAVSSGSSGASDAGAGDGAPGEEGKDASTLPPLSIATGVRGGCLAADSDAVYLCVNGTVRKMPIDGSAASTLWTAETGSIVAHVAVTNGRVVATTADVLHSIGTDGTASKDLYRGRRLHRGLAVDADAAYVMDDLSFVRVPFSGVTPKKGAYDFPTYVVLGGKYVTLTNGDASSPTYDIYTLNSATLTRAQMFSLGTKGGSSATPDPAHFAADATHLYMPAAKSVSHYVEVTQYDNPPQASGTSIRSERLGEIPANAIVDMVADETGLVLATDDAVYRYDTGTKAFVQLAKGAPQNAIALNAQYVFWIDGDVLRGTPR
jgi:hypothetical protein